MKSGTGLDNLPLSTAKPRETAAGGQHLTVPPRLWGGGLARSCRAARRVLQGVLFPGPTVVGTVWLLLRPTRYQVQTGQERSR